MNTVTKQFSSEELKRIDQADDLHISPFREDGKIYGTPTWIWEVVVDGNLYVRAYNGVYSQWFNAALIQKRGRIIAAGKTYEVQFEPVEGEINKRIDEAYKKKYSNSPYLSPMIGDRAKAATIRIIPQ
ncbi:MAG: DUF2255 family protein [Saprospiraceae bacterium]|nr:DUF2255 family protein [Candidatus Parvibacillus calidus]MCC7149187.1 DUF2255 family protein [Saprospiraceae bacterium]QLH28613.1 MAG: DUF2255 family protein [Candidatus Parvibacillus calidus]WKZ64200.1 MAG: DUF2255 family protein [Saprospiraceae bacterium]